MSLTVRNDEGSPGSLPRPVRAEEPPRAGAEDDATPSGPDLASGAEADAPRRRFILPVAAETGEALRRTVHDLAGQALPGGVHPRRLAAHGTGTHRVVATADRPDGLRWRTPRTAGRRARVPHR
ncbi:MAG: hypothetical protein HOY75_05795 [Streptomyces sp.]|nr:hypothetical protein [Streptomyces sp.]